MIDNLMKPEIPSEIIEMYLKYIDFKNRIINSKYSDLKNERIELSNKLDELRYEISTSIEEFRQENFNLVINSIDLSGLNSLKKELNKLEAKKRVLLNNKKFKEAAEIRDEKRKIIVENSELLTLCIDAFKRECLKLIDGNIYVFHAFIDIFCKEIPFRDTKDLDSINEKLRDKFIIEIKKKTVKEFGMLLKIAELKLNAVILEKIDGLTF